MGALATTLAGIVPDTTAEQRPIIFLLFSTALPDFTLQGVLGALATFAPMLVVFESQGRGVIRPQEISFTRPAKGTVINTAEGAFLDDFGEGVATITMSGHTGYGQGGGLPALKLIELLIIEYHSRRQTLRNSGADPNAIRLWFLDALNYEAFSVYPMSFTVQRSKEHPLWVYYQLQMVGLDDLLSELEGWLATKIDAGLGGLIGGGNKLLPALGGLAKTLGSLEVSFGNLL